MSVVVVLYLLVTAAGFALLLIPGIWLYARLYFGAQAAVVEGARGADALRVSSRYVDGNWWRVFGTRPRRPAPTENTVGAGAQRLSQLPTRDTSRDWRASGPLRGRRAAVAFRQSSSAKDCR